MKIGDIVTIKGEKFTVTNVYSHKEFFYLTVWLKDEHGNPYVITH